MCVRVCVGTVGISCVSRLNPHSFNSLEAQGRDKGDEEGWQVCVCVCSCMCVCVCVRVAVCLGWTCETGEETLHPLGPGTLGEEEERSHTLSDFQSVFVCELL